MKNYKVSLCLFLTLTMLLTLLAGCGAKTNEQADKPSSSADVSDYAAFSYSAGIGENGFWEGVKALDYVENFDYQSIAIPNDIHQISEDDIQSEITKMLSEYSASEQIMDRAVIDGDTVNIDYVGSVDSVEFAGGSTGGTGTDVIIGVTNYIDDFLEQLIGHMPGETINVEVTFPDDYHEETLRGKDAVFVTTINYIVAYIDPELTDDFVAENLSFFYGWTTIDEMKETLRSNLQKSAIQQYLSQYLSTEVPVRSVPDQITKYQEQYMVNDYQEYATYYGMELDEILNSFEGVASVDELIERKHDSILARSTFYLVIQAIAENAGISVSDEDLADYFVEYAGSSDYSSYQEGYGLPYLKQIVLCQKVLDYITKNIVLS